MNGEISGYYNESWSEAEICKTLLNPAEPGFQIDRYFLFINLKLPSWKGYLYSNKLITVKSCKPFASYTIKLITNVGMKTEIPKYVLRSGSDFKHEFPHFKAVYKIKPTRSEKFVDF